MLLCPHVVTQHQQQVASILRDARPKIQKWISNAETDDPESLGMLHPPRPSEYRNHTPVTDTYLQINDQINTVLNRYESYKKGDYTAAANPIPPELSNGAGPISLIDFDDGPSQSPNAAPAGGASGIDELASLFGPSTTTAVQSTPAPPAPNVMGSFGNLGYGQPASAGLGVGMGQGFGGMGFSGQSQQTQTPPTYQAPTPIAHNSMGMGAGGQPRRAGTVSPSSGAPLGSIRLGTPSTPSHPPPQPHSPGYFGQPMQPMQPMQQFQPMQPTQPQPQTQPANGQAQTQGKDPFADLVGLF